MPYLIPDRQVVAQLKYQLRRFEKQCLDLPAATHLRIQQEMQGLRRMLAERVDEGCLQDPDHVGWGCRGLGLDHRWQPSEFSDKVFCTKCGEQQPEVD